MGALTALVLVVYGPGHLGYDAFYALEWGDDLANGRAPLYERDIAPTPHPLANVVAAGLSLLGGAAVPVLVFAGAVAFAALGWAAYRLGAVLFSIPVGVLFAAIVLTREELVLQQLFTYIDVPYLALVLGAAVLEAQHERRGAPVLVLLTLAGLLRPEAWVLTGAYVLWLAAARPRNEWPRLAAIAALAPVVWMALDLLATGDPLHSLTGTRSLAEELARPNTLGDALAGAPRYVRWNLDDLVIVWGGVAGMLGVLWLAWEKAMVPLAVLAVAALTFLGLGLFGLPVLVRYMLLPSLMLALFFAAAVGGWIGRPLGRRVRIGWTAAAAALAALALLTIPDARDRLQGVTTLVDRQRDLQQDLGDLVDHDSVRARAARCGRAYVPNHFLIPQLAYWLDLPVTDVVSARVERPRRGLLLAPGSPSVHRGSALDPREPGDLEFVVPRTFEPVGSVPSWVLYERC